MGIWRKWFPSRVEELQKQQIADQKATYEAVIVRLETDFDSRVNFLRERYQDEVKYLRERVKTVEQEQERLTLFLHPNLNAISTRAEIAAFDESEKNREPEPPVMTPFQRISARVREEDLRQRLEAKRLRDAELQKQADQKDAQPQTAA
jgi:hypothetical protein